MTDKIITYVEIDVPPFDEDSLADFQTFRFALDAAYLPSDDGSIPSLIDLQIDAATVSLGEDLGARATITAKFRDHRHVFLDEPFESGTFWGKFRARYGLKLRGWPFRVGIGNATEHADTYEWRNYLIDSTNGPSAKGEFQIIAKDVLKQLDGDRAQCPILSNGFLVANISASDINVTIGPAGIGDDEYPDEGTVAIGGSEICGYTRTGDVLTLDRAQSNTVAATHNAGDRVQFCQVFDARSPADIIYDLMVNFADVDSDWINIDNWNDEIEAYLNTVYSAIITEPTSVATLVSELIEQVGLVIWWDDIEEQVRLRVLRPVPSSADTYDADNMIADSLSVTEQPDKRLSQVIIYFARINPLVNLDQLDNYRSTSYSIDDESEDAYGGEPVIKIIYSRWIPEGGRAIADQVGALLLARFHDPPRRIAFDLLRNSVVAPVLGTGYQIGGWMFQSIDGSAATVPAQITRLAANADLLEIEVEEISPDFPAGTGGGSSPGEHVIVIDANTLDVDLRDMHDSLFGNPEDGNVIRCTIRDGVIVGSSSTARPAFDVSDWDDVPGVQIFIVNLGRIEGKGGDGGAGSSSVSLTGAGGGGGGTAFSTDFPITLTNDDGEIFGGGGGGGGAGSAGNLGGVPLYGGNGGGGGAGVNPGGGGSGGVGTPSGIAGASGTADSGGVGGTGGPSGASGGAGGNPGVAGSSGGTPPFGIHTVGGLGGSAGNSIDGISQITFTGGFGDLRGPSIN